MTVSPIYELAPDGGLRFHFHLGQNRAWASGARFPVVVSGTQSGKTVFGPCWLWREILHCGPGDYMVVTPTFPLLELKALPAFRHLFETTLRLGRFVGSPVRRFTFSPQGARRLFSNWDGAPIRVYFGHAQDHESLESATAKAIWLDEVGQKKFRLESWEAVQRRLAIQQGRALFTTTPYNLGWFKQQVVDRAPDDPDYDLIRFPSSENPAFPLDELRRARKTLPSWKFRMFYLGEFERPAGLVYDAFDVARCRIPRRAIPPVWERYLGLDFGGVNLVGLFYARDPETGLLYLYRTYRSGRRTASEHVEAILEGEPGDLTAVGGAPSEDQWRDEFGAAGLPVKKPPISDVELGITRVYGLHKANRIYVFDDQHSYLDEKLSYSHLLDDKGEPTEVIEDKESYHHMDAERYLLSYLAEPQRGIGESAIIPPEDPFKDLIDREYIDRPDRLIC